MTNESELDLVRGTVRKMVTDHVSARAAQSLAEDPLWYDRALWSDFVAGGWTGLGISADLGGAGGGLAELVAIATELGNGLAATPFVGGVVLAAALQAHPASQDSRRLLDEVGAGAVVATFASETQELRADQADEGWVLSGVTGPILDAGIADLYLLPCRATDQGQGLAIVRANRCASSRPLGLRDLTRRAGRLTLDRVPAAHLLVGREARAALDAAETLGALLTAADAVGVAERALDATVTYVGQRIQFGRPVGAFQAVKHRCVDMFVKVEAARALLEDASKQATPATTKARTSVAKSFCCRAAVEVAEAAIQLHGGIGFTWEHDAHLWLRRAAFDDVLFGAGSSHRLRTGRRLLTGDPAAEG
jgi:alkylation response protein AidB-like acyl-CoA dehydrogenase